MRERRAAQEARGDGRDEIGAESDGRDSLGKEGPEEERVRGVREERVRRCLEEMRKDLRIFDVSTR